MADRGSKTEDQLHCQLYVPNGTEECLVYLDTVALQLYFGQPVDNAAINPRTNYSTIFIIRPERDKQRFRLFNYVVSENGPMAEKVTGSTYDIKLNASQGYDLIYIKDKQGKPWNPIESVAYVSISMKKDGKTVLWNPINRNSPIDKKRLIQGEAGSSSVQTPFLIKLVPRNAIHSC